MASAMLDAARRLDQRLISAARPIAPIDPIRAFTTAQAETRALWLRPSTGEALVGLGSALTLTDGAAAAWRELSTTTRTGGPILMGGFGFDPIAEPTSLWDSFGAARFILPERLITLRQGAASLTSSTLLGPHHPQQPLHDNASPRPARLGLDPESWKALVADCAQRIRQRSDGLRKVVLARAHQVPMQTSLEGALRDLATNYASCTIFAFATPGACFLGATPERLVALHEGTATTMALAGSAPRGAQPEEDRRLGLRLLADPKERTEHAIVLEALREGLAPFATRLIADAEPRLHQLPNVQHLVTPVRARVRPGCSVLDLVERLHPTPAVGGYPRERALNLIREREALDRGWYAAPVGWVGAHGGGEFVVGLRSAVVRGDTATLFAGCGIVGDSDPEAEYAEWGWKLRPMLSALTPQR